MRTPIDDTLRADAVRLSLRFSCGDCAQLEEESRRCSFGFPTAEHERSDLDRGEVVFCKAFELG